MRDPFRNAVNKRNHSVTWQIARLSLTKVRSKSVYTSARTTQVFRWCLEVEMICSHFQADSSLANSGPMAVACHMHIDPGIYCDRDNVIYVEFIDSSNHCVEIYSTTDRKFPLCSMAQWLGRRSLAGGLDLIYAWPMVDMWPLHG